MGPIITIGGRQPAAIGMAAILAVFVVGFSTGSGNSSVQYAAAQQQQQQQTATNTFSGSGVIGGIIPSSSAEGNGTTNPYVLGGTWNLNVEQGNVSNLAIEFLMMRSDGTEYHSHSFRNFRTGNDTSITLNPSGTTMLSGAADIYVNGTLKWPGVDTTVSIERMVALRVEPAEEDTDNHFQGQPIQGIVASLQDQDGNQLVQAPADLMGNQTQGGAEGFLDRLIDPLRNLFEGRG